MTPIWSTDIAAAPKGRKVTVKKIVGDKTHSQTRMEGEQVWLASKCGRVILSRWLWPAWDRGRGRWECLGTDEKPLAWRPFIEGEFPAIFDKTTKEWSYPNGKTPDYPAQLVGVAA